MNKINELVNRSYNALPEWPKLVIGTGGLALVAGLAYQNIDLLKSLADRAVDAFGMISPGYQMLFKAFMLLLFMGMLVKMGEKILALVIKLSVALYWIYVLSLFCK